MPLSQEFKFLSVLTGYIFRNLEYTIETLMKFRTDVLGLQPLQVEGVASNAGTVEVRI